jgi:lysozyme family protein
MTMPNPARNELIQARNVLVRRRATTADAAEQATIDAALDELDDAIDAIEQASLLQAAGLVADAADVLERVVASARMGPFDNFLIDIQAAITALQGRLDEMQGSERLPPAADEPTAASVSVAAPALAAAAGMATAAVAAPNLAPAAALAPAPAAAVAPAPTPASGGISIPVPINSKDFAALRAEYAEFFDLCRLRPEFASNVEFYVSRLLKHKPVYQQLAAGLNNMPWLFIGVVHGMECGFNFGTHLHNGDPLSARTVRVPSGRPPGGQPPFTWAESARDALQLKKLHLVTDWNLPRMLYLLEAYNGFGYRSRGVPSPYLWSFSNLYRAGKFVADGVYDPNAVSKQCGVAVMLRVMQERGLV